VGGGVVGGGVVGGGVVGGGGCDGDGPGGVVRVGAGVVSDPVCCGVGTGSTPSVGGLRNPGNSVGLRRRTEPCGSGSGKINGELVDAGLWIPAATRAATGPAGDVNTSS
jgi:hypothetical protein